MRLEWYALNLSEKMKKVLAIAGVYTLTEAGCHAAIENWSRGLRKGERSRASASAPG